MALSHTSAVIQNRISQVIKSSEVEMPMAVFNKMCFGFVSNNWIVVITSVLKLTTFAVILAFSRTV
jgi:hypothetical protein